MTSPLRSLRIFTRGCYRRRRFGTALAAAWARRVRVPAPTFTQRIGILEQKVQALETLPARVAVLELHIVQLREDMNAEFSATRESLRAQMRALGEELRAEMRAFGEELRAEMKACDDALRTEIRNGDEETRRYLRVLHEEVISRIATIQDHRHPRKKM